MIGFESSDDPQRNLFVVAFGFPEITKGTRTVACRYRLLSILLWQSFSFIFKEAQTVDGEPRLIQLLMLEHELKIKAIREKSNHVKVDERGSSTMAMGNGRLLQ